MSKPNHRPVTLESLSTADAEPFCVPDVHGHCSVCSDDAQTVTVLQLLDDGWTALVASEDQDREVDITLVTDVRVGQTLLVHGGVALERIELNGES